MKQNTEQLKKIEEIKRSSAYWAVFYAIEHGGFIYDPDGWDRKNFDESWSEKITYKEFKNRAMRSTQVGVTEMGGATKLLDDLIQTTPSHDEIKREAVTGETSDGYHTFNELYAFRKLFNAGFFNELMHPYKSRMFRQYNPYNVHKSKKHSDGEECFGGGWFIVMATLPTGQISNHYELKDWDLFDIEEREKADVWDGHTAQDVLTRLTAYLTQSKEGGEETK